MIPLDVVALIFMEYRDDETVDCPVETLLMVCKSWRSLGLGLRMLWSKFNIVFGTSQQARKWASLLPKRLERSGQSTPLHTTILNNRKNAHRYRDPQTGYIDHERCPELEAEYSSALGNEWPPACACRKDIPQHIGSILKLLAGQKGEGCQRWATLHLYLNSRGHHPTLFEALVYPTPNLRVLTLQGMDSTSLGTGGLPLFPNLPSLSDISLKHSQLPHLHVALEGVVHTGSHLKRLELQEYVSYPCRMLPKTLHSLTSLVLRESYYGQSDVPLVLVPNLTSLTRELTLGSVNRPNGFFTIPFENLRNVGIFYHGRARDELPVLDSPYTKEIISMLSKASHVEEIVGDEFSIMTLFLILSTSPLPGGLHLMATSLKVYVIDRRDCSRIDSAVEGGKEVYAVALGEDMAADIDHIRKRRGWDIKPPSPE